ncbi:MULTISPECIES: HdeD family acid-resistance protein [unclassified Arthrobacter]|uniref:HdeD family acid-resistance protein n=1 Tax=unclassified Arthrobacter TaxID=235627 RepID=UPI001D14E0AB|nr:MULTISPECIES: DUF308 domain-containing protein [unclassified Arthrobacter]MCC3275245.1 DUF308 domain-containing protein [Arthrobacter sp. zg-Y20]MCC3278321.1 DUF308 domain-containing protein [Arthrobacter sp. zg-Y40]MCC9176691.1 DUF308 domain-containing protein [Arthrobacter sp. zg-Y750]MDK1315402.1 DUF308 domain-containing protein [Arthrobacter sp. zg.Y20]MDK1326605.1 DUF308 domain-containing protein [Arthrobacter sp. zg-Y1143]
MSTSGSAFHQEGGFALDALTLAKSAIRGIRLGLATIGVVSVVLGLLVLFWPGATLEVLAVLFGLYFVVAGAIRILLGVFTGLGPGLKILNILVGLALVAVGVIAIRNPAASLTALALVIGIAWIVEGVMSLAESDRGGSRWFAIVLGVLSILAGIVVLFIPVESLAVLVIYGGIFLVVLGIIQIVRAFTFGRGMPRNA